MTHACSKSTPPPTRRLPVRWSMAAAVLLGFSGHAAAADLSIGLSAGADQGRVDCVASFPCNHRSTHVKLTAGYQFAEAMDVQAAYFDAGSFKGGDTTPLGTQFGGSFKVNGIGVTLGYRWDLAPLWSLTARAGLASVRTRFDYANTVWGSASQTTTQPLLGLGVAYAITPTLRLGLDYDVTRFKVHTTRGPLQMFGLAAQFSF